MKYFDLVLEDKLKSIPNPFEGEGTEKKESSDDASDDAAEDDADAGDEKSDKEDNDDADEDDKEEKDDEDDEEESDLSDAEQLTAKNLYKALKNPSTAKHMIASLMAQAGITGESTKKEVTETKKALEAELAEFLGDDYKFLAGRIAKAVEHATKRLTSEAIKPLEETQANMLQVQKQRDVDSALSRLDGEFDVPQKIANRVLRLMQDNPHNGKQEYYPYVKGLLFMASADLDIPLTKKGAGKEKEERRNRNRNEANIPAASSGSGRKVKQAASLDEAISMAMDSIKKTR